jgi:hypothetical protein
MIELGWKVKDMITGFIGTATARVEYITGCDQILVAPPVDEAGKHVDALYFDVNRLEVVSKERVELDTSEDKGACESAPIK